MFDIRLRIVLLVVTLLSMVLVVRISRKARMEIRDASNWFVFCLLLVIAAAVPELVVLGAQLVGIEVPSNAVFSFLIFFLLCLVYYLNIRISRISMQLKELVQQVALLEKRLRDQEAIKPKK